MVWDAKRIPVWWPDENGLPTHPYHLVIANNVLNRQEIKYFVSTTALDLSRIASGDTEKVVGEIDKPAFVGRNRSSYRCHISNAPP